MDPTLSTNSAPRPPPEPEKLPGGDLDSASLPHADDPIRSLGEATCSSKRDGIEKAWRVTRLWEAASVLPLERANVADLAPLLDQVCWFRRLEEATASEVVRHCQRIQEADLNYPIIISQEGWIMDGMHRLAKAMMLGHTTIKCVRFESDPEPDLIINER